ncbi:hypothetical protein AVEN_222080-1 [Araneus ventricosus]|uniref:DUF5641 domain-containing protein n=1 Tax=Araneus ventricosus TaxID=182803 RepID=A0A4Y2DXM4_ARAVE|nr:hypothetical protein AVEN_222080-1 [Araneus ventricosus]
MIESREILSPAKFNLRGWEHAGVSAGGKSTILEKEKKVPVLGLIWKPNKDTLSVNWEETSKFNETPITKRKILSAVHRIFDTIGFTCPVTLKPKILLQECWKLGVTWDTELPFSISRKFEKWKEQLKCLNNLEIPRCISEELYPNSDLSLHVFCDASKTAYASCVFLRTEIDGTITCQFVQARARVSPIKAITIPRLELLACTIVSRLVNTTKSDLGLEDVPICCWSDSVNVLYWITGKENWGTFVNNRVQEIRRLTNPEDWKHIAGILNPADLPSRGCGAEELTESLWWEGPSWLKKPLEELPFSEACPGFAIINSERKRTVASAIDDELKELDYLFEISSYEKIIRVTAWIFRFYNNIRKQQNDRDFGDLNTQETDAAERAVLKIVQTQSFPNDTNSLISQMQMLGQLRNFSQSQKEDVIKEGDIVLIRDTNSKRIYWPLAKVMKLIPGRDGRVRVVEVSTGGGSFLRPIQRLYPLEVSGADRTVWQKRNTKTVDDRVWVPVSAITQRWKCVATPLPTSDVTGRLNFSTNPEQASSARTLLNIIRELVGK